MRKRVISAVLLIFLLSSMIPSALAEDTARETISPQVSEEPATEETPLPSEEPTSEPTPDTAGGGCYSIAAAGRATGLKFPSKEQLDLFYDTAEEASYIRPNKLGLNRITNTSGGSGALGLSQAAPGNGVYTKEDAAGTSNTVTAVTLPHVVDNSKLKYFPQIGDQGSLGSCGAFAMTYYLMTYTTAMARNWDVKAGGSSMIFSPKWSYNLVNGGSDNGSWIGGIATIMSEYGAPTLSEFPYDTNYREWPNTSQVWRSAIKYKTDGLGYISNINTPAGLANLKSALNNGMVVCMTTLNMYGWKGNAIKNNPNSTLDDSEVKKHATYYMESGSSGHAITIVGYNDDIWIDRNDNNKLESGELGGFRVANSWGSWWGDQGFTWFSYAAINDTVATTGHSGIMSGNSVTYLITDGADYIPQVTAEITLTTAHRNDIEYSYGINWGQTTLPDMTSMFDWARGCYYKTANYVGFPLSRSGGDYSIAGTTDLDPGTIMLDLTEGVKGQNKNMTDWAAAGGPLSFSVGVRDTEGDSTPVTVNNIVFENWNTGERITAAELGEPQTIDNDFCWYHSTAVLNPGLPVTSPDPAVSALPQIAPGTIVNAECISKTDVREWRFTPAETGTYIFKTNSQNIYTEIQTDARKLIYSGSKTNGDITYISATLFSGETYVLRASIANTYLNSHISFKAQVYKIDPVSDADLSDIFCKDQYYRAIGISPEFNKDTLSYTVIMLADQSGIMIFPVPESERSFAASPTAPYTGTAIALGESKDFVIETVSRDGTNTREYHVTAIKPAAFTVTLDPQGGAAVDPITVANSSYISQSPSTQRPGYVFAGWYPTPECNTAAVRFPYKAVGNITLYAKWVFSGISGYYRYRLDGGNAIIIKYSGSESKAVIPNTLDGYPVKAIDNEAFRNNAAITDLTLSEGITSVGARTFSYCSKLKNVFIPQSVTNIGEQAFYNCRCLSRAYFKGNAPSMGSGVEGGNQVFYGCMPCFTVYRLNDKTGFADQWYGWPAAVYDPDVSFTVTFNKNGAAAAVTLPQTVFSGVKLLEPSNPRRYGYTFGGWYTDSQCTGEYWDFGTDQVLSEFVLYAKWIPNSSVVLRTPSLKAKASDYKTVTLTWKAVTNAKGYAVYKKINGVYKNVATVDGDLTYTDTDVKTEVYYYYKIRAYNVPYKYNAYSGYSYYRYAKPAWPAITLTAKSYSYNSIRLTWNEVNGADGYEIYRSETSGGFGDIPTFTVAKGPDAKITFTDNDNGHGLITGKTYYYRIRAYDVTDTGTKYSLYCSCRYAKPAWPAITLTAKPYSYNSIQLTWNGVNDAEGYEIYRSETSGGFGDTPTYTVAKGTEAKTDNDNGNGLITGKTYYYRIRAYGVTDTGTKYSPYSCRYAKPAWPAITLTAKSYSYNSIQLTWNKIEGADGYEVYRSTSYRGPYVTPIHTAETRDTIFYTDKDGIIGLTAGKTYYYEIRAFYLAGEDKVYSPYSSYKYAKPVPSAPVIALQRMSATSINISWGEVEGAIGYEVWRAASLNGTYTRVTTTDKLSYENTGLCAGRNYYYKVRAYTGTTKVFGPYSEKKRPQ